MAYRQTVGAIAGLYEFAPQEEESEVAEVDENGQEPELELAEAEGSSTKKIVIVLVSFDVSSRLPCCCRRKTISL